MRNVWLFFVLATVHVSGTSDLQADIDNADNGVGVLRRSRRYVVFPEGSTFNIAFCLTLKALTGGDFIFTEGTNWILSYDLPNETIHDRRNAYDFPVGLRRHKRDLYTRMEKLIDSSGVGGRDCVLNTICDAGQQLAPRQGILEEILRLLFADPENSDLTDGVSDYQDAYRRGNLNENCNDLYPCPVSFLQLALQFGDFHESPGYP